MKEVIETAGFIKVIELLKEITIDFKELNDRPLQCEKLVCDCRREFYPATGCLDFVN